MSERMVHVQIRNFTEELLEIADMVIEMLTRALDAGRRHDDHIGQFKHIDRIITLKEINLEERCLTFLATEHPAAIDLRTIVSIMKTRDDLKRINDLTLHIIERIPDMSAELFESFEFESIGKRTVSMIEKSINAFVSRNLEVGTQVYALNDEIHGMLQHLFRTATALMNHTRIDADQLLSALSISRHFGLITEHSGNIARTAHYLVTGEIVPRTHSFYNQLTASLDNCCN